VDSLVENKVLRVKNTIKSETGRAALAAISDWECVKLRENIHINDAKRPKLLSLVGLSGSDFETGSSSRIWKLEEILKM